MKLNYYTQSGKLFSNNGEEIIPDEKGIAILEIEGSKRPFVLSKFITKLESGTEIKLHNAVGKIGNRRGWSEPKPEPKEKPAKVPVVKKKVVKPKPAKTGKLPKVKKPKQVKEPRPQPVAIISIDANNQEREFKNIKEAVSVLGICQSGISETLAGKYKQMSGYTFRRATDPPKKYIPPSKSNEHKKKAIIAISPDGKELEFESVQSAGPVLKIWPQSISSVLNGRKRNVNGYQFKFKTA